MTIRLAVVMDPVSGIHFQKDSTLAMLWEAQDRGYELFYFEQKDLFLRDGIPYGEAHPLRVSRDAAAWYQLGDRETIELASLNVILMRKDPPFDANYIYSTYILDHAEQRGVMVVNKPQTLRDCNEKFFTASFPQCAPPMLVTQSADYLHAFLKEQKDIVCKPLDAMGGTSIFRLVDSDVNANVVFETLTHKGRAFIVAQQYIPDIIHGDKRILLLDGEPVPHALVRVPQGNDWRGNLAAGAKGVIQPLTERDQFICAQLAPELKKRGLYFVGIDVIGDFLTEINITSPTGIREIDAGANINVSAMLMDVIESHLG